MKLAWATTRGFAEMRPSLVCECGNWSTELNTDADLLNQLIVIDLHDWKNHKIHCLRCKVDFGYHYTVKTVSFPVSLKKAGFVENKTYVMIKTLEIDEGPFDPNHEPAR